ncbi:MAG TPA: DUF2059 domain-containing protein [Candidatus Angelobacter sp.]|nr:DUF2059 domain-containing protein [Candidatus Angelobacter sp.]
MRKATLLFLVVFFALPALAQQSVAEAAALARSSNQASADSPTRDQVMTLLELLQVRKTMSVMLESMKKVMIDGAERGFRERVPNPTPKQLAALHGMFDDIVNASMDDMINALIPIYQRHLTKADLEELIRFYSSPVGQKLLHEQPAIIQESMQAGAEVQQRRMDEIRAKIQQRMQQLEEASQDDTPAPKK